MVVSHAFYTAYDPVTPASLSPEIATGLLRDELGFEGVAITDDLGAGAMGRRAASPAPRSRRSRRRRHGPGRARPATRQGVREALIAAGRVGAIPAERIDQAVGRVLELKRSLGLLRL